MAADGEAPDVESSVASAEGPIGMPHGGHEAQVNETDVLSMNGSPVLITPVDERMLLDALAMSNNVAIEEGSFTFSGGLTSNDFLALNGYMQDMSGLFNLLQASEETNLTQLSHSIWCLTQQ